MKRSIKIRKIAGVKSLTRYIDRLFKSNFSRTGHEIESLDITVSDVNGPKGGADKHCQIIIKPTGLDSIVIRETQPDTRHAIFRAFARASKSLTRKLKHKRHNFRERSLAKDMHLNPAG